MAEYKLPSLADFAEAEHCVLEDVTSVQPTLSEGSASASMPAREINEEFSFGDALRGCRTSVRLYLEGWADVEVKRRGQYSEHLRYNLSYLDPVPLTSTHFPKPLLQFAGVTAVLGAAAAGSWQFGFYATVALQAAVACAALTVISLLVTFYRSYQKITFRTVHGRADAMSFTTGLGAGFSLRRRLPRIIDAVARASSSEDEDTATYLRGEMREHYRLRNEGLLSEDDCAEATGRILNEFGGPL